jgi:VWFA-related protein
MLKYTTTILLLAWPAAIHAQPPEPARAQFADQLDIRLVHVDVRVERKGKPVTDLGMGDFVLLEDGEPVEIAVFSPPHVTASTGEAVPVAEASAAAPPESEQASGANGGTVAVFIDDVSLGPGQRNRALRTVQALSEPSNPHGAELVVFRHFRRGHLTLQLGRGAVADAADFEELGRASAVREQQGIFFAMREIENVLAHSNCIDSRGQLLGVADNYGAAALASSELRAQLLDDAIQYLSALPGRKMLIVVAGRIEIQPGVAILEHLQDLCPDLASELSNRVLSTQNMANRLHRVAGLANSHRVTLVTVDARGIGAPSQANATLDSARFGGSQLNQLITNANLQSGLTQLASETGGSTIFNANNVVKPLLRSLEEAEAVYTLAFYPQHQRTGARHILEVRLVGDVKRRTRLHYRRSYLDRTMQQEWADGLRTAARAPALRPDASLPNPLGAQLLVTENPDGLVVSLGLGTDAVTTLLSLSSQSERRLRLLLYVVDPEGRETAAREGFLAGPSAPEPWQASVRLALPVGEWTVAAALRDEVTGEISLLRQAASPAL